jgi:hypothetical protein
MNMNKALLDERYAVIDDHDNEFNPYSWRRTYSDLSTQYSITIIGVSLASSFVVVVLINRIKNKIQRARARTQINPV